MFIIKIKYFCYMLEIYLFTFLYKKKFPLRVESSGLLIEIRQNF